MGIRLHVIRMMREDLYYTECIDHKLILYIHLRYSLDLANVDSSVIDNLSRPM